MIGQCGSCVPPNPETNPKLAELTEEITRRLLAGEPFDEDAYVAQHPDCAEPIRDLLPTMLHLVELGRTVARERQNAPRPDPSHPLTKEDHRL